NADGSVTALRPTPGGSLSEPDAINDSNVAAGFCNDVEGTMRAVKWSANGTPSALFGLPGEVWGRAWDINNAGVVVGHSSTADGMHAVRWSAGGTITRLREIAGNPWSQAYGINGSGVVVGAVYGPAPDYVSTPVRWSATNTVTTLRMPAGYNYAEAIAINAGGTIVGHASNGLGGNQVAVKWNPDGSVVVLGTLPGDSASGASDINTGGTAVGDSYVSFSPEHPVKWSPSGAISPL
ncbi:MAG TPA: hypothetical protein VFR67_19455, partial [Pilimelia sp.]|nr:hypothetical protein [Pilimelia sp.]